jgi:uncharacterized membrane protein YeaQ/YmgE (transglycosylase-associated protein family)
LRKGANGASGLIVKSRASGLNMMVAIGIIGAAVATLACVWGWNAAAHRKDLSGVRIMSILFCLFAATLLAGLIKLIFFAS